MPAMSMPDEVAPAPADVTTPLPSRAHEMVLPTTPTPAAVLAAVAAAGGRPWFPSRHAADTDTDRDALDEPLAVLRTAGLVRVAAWERGLGQGYVLTPEGEDSVATGAGVPAPGEKPAAEPAPAEDVVPEPVPLMSAPGRPTNRLGLDVRPPVLVPILLIANVLWFFAGLVAAVRGDYPVGQYLGKGHPYLLHRLGAVSGTDLLDGEWWRLISSCFVHIGLLHLLANLFALAMVGPLAELLWGRWRLAVIYAVSGLAGSCLAMGHRPDTLLAGASGAIWGVLGSLLAWLILYRQYLPRDVAADWARRLWIVFLLNGAVSLLPGISWEGHLGGGVGGFVAAGLLNALRHGTWPRRILALLLLSALAPACLLGLVAAMNHYGPWVDLRQRRADARALSDRRDAANAELERLAALKGAVQGYTRDLVPRFQQLAPEPVRAVEQQATWLLLRPAERRNPEVLAGVRAKVEAIKKTADELAGAVAPPPPAGLEMFAPLRDRAGAVAAARSRSFALLLQMLDSPAAPDAAAWEAWGEARRAADAAWGQPPPPKPNP